MNPSSSPVHPGQGKRPDGLEITTLRQIMVSVLAGAFFAFLLLKVIAIANLTPPLVPWSVPIILVIIGIAVWFYTRSFRRRLENRQVKSEEGIRALVLGKSMLMTGSVLAGGHLVYVLMWITQTEIPGPRERVIHGMVTIVAAIFFAIMGAILEKACVIDINDGDGPTQPV